MLLYRRKVIRYEITGKASHIGTSHKNVLSCIWRKYRPAPVTAPIVTMLVDSGMAKRFARKRLNVADARITRTTSVLINPRGNIPWPRVFATFAPRVNAPKITNTGASEFKENSHEQTMALKTTPG